MNELYSQAVAEHYAAYRPPLHTLILERLLAPDERFETGLDIGCGTGYSTIALARYCERVFGIDSSEAMLAGAQKHPQITYVQGNSEDLRHFTDATFDIVTFAGSLFYTKSETLRKALLRVCRQGSTVLVYDFAVLLDSFTEVLGLQLPPENAYYDHAVNLSGWDGFQASCTGKERVTLEAPMENIAHVLLADAMRYAALVERFPKPDVFSAVKEFLKPRSTTNHLSADILFARYKVRK